MFTLRVLGTIELEGPDGRRVSSVLSQPKRLSLLVVLALSGRSGASRDELVGRLWADVSEEKARGALRQALYYLRRSLGPETVTEVGGADRLGIDPDRLWCDAVEVERAAGEDRSGDVLAHYAGDLLPGFHLGGAPAAFEHWLEGHRRGLRRHAAEAARRVAEREAEAGNAVAAGAAARRAWELGDWGEPGLRALLRILVRTGDVGGASAAYAEYADRLRREHGTEPSAETRAILEVASGASADVEAADRSAGGAPEDRERAAADVVAADTSAGGGRAGPGPRRKRAEHPGGRWRSPARGWAVAAVLTPLLLLAVWAVWSRTETGGSESPGATLMLEPVRALGVGAGAASAEGITRDLAARLKEPEGFAVVLSDPAEAGVRDGIMLRPALRRDGDSLELSVLILDGRSNAVLGRVLAARVPEGGDADLLSARLAPRIRERVGDLLAVWGLEARGIGGPALEAVRAAAAAEEEADRLRDQNALGASAAVLEGADSTLARAEALGRGWVEPTIRRAALARDRMWLFLLPPEPDERGAHRTLLEGIEHADRAVALEPGNARALETRGMLRSLARLTASDGETARAMASAAEADLRAAVRLDPSLPRAWSSLSLLSEERGAFADAYYQARRAYEADFALRAPLDILGRLFHNAVEVGDDEGAARWCEALHHQAPSGWMGTYCDLYRTAWMGPWDAARSDSLLQEGVARASSGRLDRPDVRSRMELLHAVTLVRAGRGRAARALLARHDQEVNDPGLLELRAWVRVLLGDEVEARALLAVLEETMTHGAAKVLESRRFADVSRSRVVRTTEP